jgi:hypothetical protein
MYPILEVINLYFYPTTNLLHPIFLFTYFLLFFISVPLGKIQKISKFQIY